MGCCNISADSLIVRLLREELQLLMEPGSYVGEVVKAMGKTKVLVKVQPEGKYSKYLDFTVWRFVRQSHPSSFMFMNIVHRTSGYS